MGDRGRALAPHATKRRADGLIRRFGRATLRLCGGWSAGAGAGSLAKPSGAELGGGARSRREDKGKAPSSLALPLNCCDFWFICGCFGGDLPPARRISVLVCQRRGWIDRIVRLLLRFLGCL